MPKISDIEDTPNPNAVKFVLKEKLSWGKHKSFETPESAWDDPLASRLFQIPHVVNVFYMDNWITVTQDGEADWPDLVRKVAIPIREAEAARKPEFSSLATGESDDPRLAAIRQIIEDDIRPALMGDGGDLEIVSLAGNVLCIRYYGACGSCPSAQAGTLSAIESMVRRIEPDIQVVSI